MNGQIMGDESGAAAQGVRPSDRILLSPANNFPSVAAAILIPLPATLLISTNQALPAAAVTLVLTLIAGLSRMRAAVFLSATSRYASGIDSVMFILTAVVSAVVIGTSMSPGDSKLFRLQYSGFSGETDIAPSFLTIVWCFCLSTLPVPGQLTHSKIPTPVPLNKRTLFTLGILGATGLALSLTVSRYDVFSTRGESGGNGLNSLLYWSAAVFVSYVVVMHRRKDPSINLFVAALMTLCLLATGNRSPMALIGIAFFVRILIDRRHRFMRLIGAFIPLGLVVFSYQSIWRSLVAHGLPASFSDVVSVMLANPLQEFLRLGVDTVDGHALVTRIVQEGFSPRWLDPLLAITNFVPRQIWEDKPILLGSTIGHDYLGLTAGGIFLSGPGYFALVAGSIWLGAAIFVGLILAIKQLATAQGTHPIVLCAAFYLVARMAIAGDAFDIFLAVQITVILGLANLIGRGLPWQRSSYSRQQI